MDSELKDRLRMLTKQLMVLPGLSGHEGRVRRALQGELDRLGLGWRTDNLGNLIATIDGNHEAPSVMLFAHMDQLGLVVRKIEPDGFVRVERLGGVPERALAAQQVLFMVADGPDRHGVIANKSHHATSQAEKYQVVPYPDLFIDLGLDSAQAVRASGIDIGTPITIAPRALDIGPDRLAGTALDDRACCAVLVEVARAITDLQSHPSVHIVFTVQEEFNLRGAQVAAQDLQPDIAIQLDVVVSSDTPDLETRGEVRLGSGPVISLYSFHGRGTLNGTLPHPAMVALAEQTASDQSLPLQRSAHTGLLTDSSYVQLVGRGVATIDLGIGARYTHSPLEVCDINDMVGLASLLPTMLARIDASFNLDRDGHIG